jgi:hypothetical protein
MTMRPNHVGRLIALAEARPRKQKVDTSEFILRAARS